MRKNVLLVLTENRKSIAIDIQKILTDYGCIIKTRLGLHESADVSSCSNAGLIILELIGKEEEQKDLLLKLNELGSLSAKLISLEI